MTEKEKIVIFPFKGQGSTALKQFLMDETNSALLSNGHYIVVERESLEEIIQEEGFQISNLGEQEAIDIGNLIGVEKVVIGIITAFEAPYYVRDQSGDKCFGSGEESRGQRFT